MLKIKGTIKFAIPAKVSTGEVVVAKNQEGIGQLALVVNRDLTNDVATFAFLDRSKGGDRLPSSFIQCYLITETDAWLRVRLTDENLIPLITAFEKKTVVDGDIKMVQDLQTFDVWYVVDPNI